MKRDILLHTNIKKRSPVGVGGTGVFGSSELLLKQAVSLVPECPETKTANQQQTDSGKKRKNDA